MNADLPEDLRDLLGAAHVLTAEDDVAPYVEDWTGNHRGRALAVVRPGTSAEVAEVVRRCVASGVSVVPQGGNTGLVAGSVPDDSGRQVVVSLGRMRRIREVDPVAGTITVDAGCVLAEVRRAAATVGHLFPLSVGSEGSCTIGGNLSTNAGGTAVLRYGMMRELVLGVEAVLPDGRLWDGLRALRKDNTGLDLAGMFVGAEGTLGIVTGVVLRLFPATPRRATAWAVVPDIAASVALLGLARRRAGAHLSTFELMNRQAVDLVVTHLPGTQDPTPGAEWTVLIELAGGEHEAGLGVALEDLLAAAVEEGLVSDAAVAGSPAQREALWALREGVSEAQRAEGATLKHDVTLPIARLASWVDDTAPLIEQVLPGTRLVTYGHVGDGNLHYNLSAPVGDDAALIARADALSEAVYAAVAAAGGSISAEHGLGRSKAVIAASYKSDVEVDMMRAVKDALDPAGLMNPGVLLPPARAGSRQAER